jgi:hypothetical protein
METSLLDASMAFALFACSLTRLVIEYRGRLGGFANTHFTMNVFWYGYPEGKKDAQSVAISLSHARSLWMK